MKTKLLFVFVLIAAISLVSCQKENADNGTNHNEVINNDNDDNGEDNNGGNGNGENNNLFFRFSSTGANLDWHSGKTSVYFESNSEWSVTLDKSHFGASASVSPTSGNGRGSVVVSYGEETDHYNCSDYLYVKFRYVDKIYSNGDKHYDVKSYTITRRYNLIEP